MPAKSSKPSRKNPAPKRNQKSRPDPAPKQNTPGRRIGTESSKTRAALIDAAERLIREDGYAAVTSRRLAGKAGLKHQLVHYYFRTMDDLFLAVWRRLANKNLEHHAKALASQPLRALWDFNRNQADTTIMLEFMALAHHRKAIREELSRDGDLFRKMQVKFVAQAFDKYGLDRKGWSPGFLTLLIASVSRMLVMEAELGSSGGHAETIRLIERWLKRFEGPPARAPRRKQR